ncbi:MAG TPA: hypothetical protein VFD71_00335 [Planctomycetota bacterium]|jgi:hypothetical protein|nr:hypothetical protein [Planctomycetota bacterium]
MSLDLVPAAVPSRAKRVFSFVAAAFFAVAAVSCSSTPSGSMSVAEKMAAARSHANASDSASQAIEAGGLPQPVPSAPPQASEAYFNLAPSASPANAAADARLDAAPRSGATAAGTLEARAETQPPGRAAVIARVNFDDVPDAVLIGELEARWSREWDALTGGVGKAADAAAETDRLDASRRILALSLLTKDHGAASAAALEAISSATCARAPMDEGLLAAAYLIHHGRVDEAREVIAAFTPSSSRTDTPSASGGKDEDGSASRFVITSLSFARSIEGPGRFTPAGPGDVVPGKSILVYGEFKNFRNVEEKRAESSVFRRSFSAVLRLVRENGDTVDELEFLPKGRGEQEAASLTEVTNFWARYRIPFDLVAGSYKLVVDAQDLLGSAAAHGEISFRVDASDAARR